MGGMTDSLTSCSTVLIAAGVATIIKQFTTVAPPTTVHAILSAKASPLDREDVDNFTGFIDVTIDWFSPGVSTDGQTQFLAAMDAFDLIVTALASGLDRTCVSVDPGGNIERNAESADLAHWYTGTITARFLRKEP